MRARAELFDWNRMRDEIGAMQGQASGLVRLATNDSDSPEVEVLVAPSEGRKDSETARMSGRARDNRLVHFAVPDGAERARPGDLVRVGVTYGAPHHLVADDRLTDDFGAVFQLNLDI